MAGASRVVSRRASLKGALLAALLVVMVNLPLAQVSYTSWRIERSGTDVTAKVTGTALLPPRDDPSYVLAFELPDEVTEDPAGKRWTAEVDRATYDRAVADGEVTVRVLLDRPAAHTVEGQVTGRTGLIVTLIADLILLLLILFLRRFRGRLRPRLEAVALTDLEPCEPGVALEKLEGGDYLIRGEVTALEDGQVEIALGDRMVRVLLDGHRSTVAHGQPGQVRGRLIG